METIIYYFSGTGNSLKVAAELSKKLGTCELLPIAGCIKRGNYKVTCKRVGFVFPLYYLGIPKMVLDFLNKLDFSETEYVFEVITRGWPLGGGAIKQMRKLMNARGLRLDLGTYIHMPMNDFTLATVPSEKNQERILKDFDKQINKVFTKIRSNEEKYDFEPISFLLEKRNTPFANNVNQMDQYFSVNKSCIGCGLCEKTCPADNICIEYGRPHWNNRCQMCLACFHHCPQKAIEYKNKCENIIRYHHPDITVQQIMNQKV